MSVLNPVQLIFFRLKEHSLPGNRISARATVNLLDMRIPQVVREPFNQLVVQRCVIGAGER
jgi:hypothetical protein